MKSLPAASIWFEVWGVVNPVAEIFDSSGKNSDFQEIFPDFSGKNSDDPFFSRQLKKLSFHLYSYKKKVHERAFSNVLSAQNTLYCFPRPIHDPLKPSGTPRHPQINIWGVATSNHQD